MKVRFAVSLGLASPEPDELAQVVGRAEEAGFDTLWMSDVPSRPGIEPSLGTAFVSACTRRMHLGANFIPFGLQPYAFAHRMAQLDRLTRGRLLVTLVPGQDLPGERAVLGTAGRHRGRMMEELVPRLRRWWSGEAEEGSDTRLPVLPVQQPLEIWLGGTGPDSVGRAGRVADGWLGSLVSPEQAGKIRQGIQDEAAAAGRTIDPEHFGLSIGYAHTADDVERSMRLRPLRPRPWLDGEPEPADLVPVGAEALRRLSGRLLDQGISKFVLRPLASLPSAEAWSEELGWLADTVLDLQT